MTEPAQTGQLRSWTCGDLPVELEVQRNGVRFRVYSALQDQGDSVSVVELTNATHAQQIMLGGVVRLLVLTLSQQYKFARQQFVSNRELMLLGQGSVGQKPLADALAERTLRQCFMADENNLPRSRQAFEELIERHRSELDTTMTRMNTQMLDLFKDWRVVRQGLSKLNSSVFTDSRADIERQLQGLLPAHFLHSTEQFWFAQLPRYLKALARRVERLSGNTARDAQLLQQVQPFVVQCQHLSARKSLQQTELSRLKWMIEEFRVSLFAQELKTAIPVSAKRLSEQVELARKEIQYG